jgi:hypothetical protein
MKKYLLASMLIIGLAGSAFAAKEIAPSSPMHFAVKDTVGVCSVVDVMPSPASDLKIIGNQAGYASEKEAAGAQELPSTTGSVVARAGRQLQFDHKR